MLSSAHSHRRGLPGGRAFRLLLTSLAVSACGDWLYNVALLALVYDRTGSATWVALTTGARILPLVVLGPLAGALADRRDRRELIVVSALIRAGLMVALAGVAVSGLPILLAPLLAALASGAGTVEPPCVAASTARFVPGDDLQRANGLRVSVYQGAIVAGPAIGSLVLLASSPSVAILGNALTFVLSAVAVLAIPAGPEFLPSTDSENAPGLLADLRTGVQALREAPTVVKLAAADVICSSVYGFLSVALVLVADRLGAGDGGYGVLMCAFGAGGVVGAIGAGRVDGANRWRALLMGALLLVAVMVAAIGIAPTFTVAVGLALFCGGGMVVGEVLSETALPRLVGDDVIGRAYGLVLPASLAGIVAGALVAGPLVSLLGLTGSLAAVGLGVFLAAGLLLRRPLATAPAPAAAQA